MAWPPHDGGRLCPHGADILSRLQHRRCSLRLCRRHGVAVWRLAIAGDGGALALHRPDRARRGEHVPADREPLLDRLRHACLACRPPLALARLRHAARRADAARVLFPRYGLARRPVRRGLADRSGARLFRGRSHRTTARALAGVGAAVGCLRRVAAAERGARRADSRRLCDLAHAFRRQAHGDGLHPRTSSLLCLHPFRLLRGATRRAPESATLDPGFRSRRHYLLCSRKPVPGGVEHR